MAVYLRLDLPLSGGYAKLSGMKILVLLILLGIISLIFYLRLRPYLTAGRRAYKLFKAMQNGERLPDSFGERLSERAVNQPVPANKKRKIQAENLVRCGRCAKWVSAGQAISLGTQQFCSYECLGGAD